MVTTGKTEDWPFGQLWTLSDSYNTLHHHTCMVMNYLEQKNLGPSKWNRPTPFLIWLMDYKRESERERKREREGGREEGREGGREREKRKLLQWTNLPYRWCCCGRSNWWWCRTNKWEDTNKTWWQKNQHLSLQQLHLHVCIPVEDISNSVLEHCSLLESWGQLKHSVEPNVGW